jgi:phosphoglycerate kinase
MKTIKEINLDNKKVIVRVDFNVPLNSKTGEIEDDFRIRAHLETIDFLKQNNAVIILISHLGKPKGREVGLSLKPVAEKLKAITGYNVKFCNDCIGDNAKREIGQMSPGDIIVLENLRFHPEEEENNEEFASKLAQLGDLFIEDAFPVCHRAHASTVGITRFLPFYPGFLLEKEISSLEKVIKNPKKPFITLIGGVKITTKTEVIEHLLKISDGVLLGGKVANTILKLKGLYGDSMIRDREILEAVRNINLDSPKLIVPIDGMIGKGDSARGGGIDTLKKDEEIFDIGQETMESYKKIIGQANTIIWNGPMGFCEKEVFSKGSLEIAKAIAASPAYSVVGGGETINFLKKNKLLDKISFVSSGGGAMLDFIAGKKLPGIEALNK